MAYSTGLVFFLSVINVNSFGIDLCRQGYTFANGNLHINCVKRLSHRYQWAVCMPYFHGISSNLYSWKFCELDHSDQRCSCDPSQQPTHFRTNLSEHCFKSLDVSCEWYEKCLREAFPQLSSKSEFKFVKTFCDVVPGIIDKRGAGLQFKLTKCVSKNFFIMLLKVKQYTINSISKMLGEIFSQCLISQRRIIFNLKNRQYVFWEVMEMLITAGNPQTIVDSIDTVFYQQNRNIIPNVIFYVHTVVGIFIKDETETSKNKITNELKWRESRFLWKCKYSFDKDETPRRRRMVPLTATAIVINTRFECLTGDLHRSEYEHKKLILQDINTALRDERLTKLGRMTRLTHVYVYAKGSTWCCYQKIGCIEIDMPLSNIIRNEKHVHPESPEQVRATFTLFTRGSSHPTSQILDVYASDGGMKTCVSSKQKTYFIVHGFFSDGTIDFSDNGDSWIRQMMESILRKKDAYVVVVNWEHGATKLNYYKAAMNTLTVGTLTARVISLMIQPGCTDLEDIHLIGHSLGAHVVGFAGASLKGRVGRITGLDPAGPFFEKKSENCRLDKRDAKFVDIIHSNGRLDESSILGNSISDAIFDEVFLGIFFPIGDADFYPNGGMKQPGCKHECSHSRAYQYFIHSIDDDCFEALECSTAADCLTGTNLGTKKAIMGFGVSSDSHGMFHLNTTSESPFCINSSGG